MKNKILPEQMKEFMSCLAINKENPAGLIPSVHDAQRIFGGVPLEIQKQIATEHKVSVSKVSGIVSFYDYFTSDIQGENIIEVCVGTSCYVNESQQLLDKVCEITKCDPNSTSRNKKYTVIIGRCLGKCEFAPNVIVNHKLHNNVTIDKVARLINEIDR